MQATEVEANEVPFRPHPKDPRKPGAIVTVEIDCAVDSCILPSGQMVTEGLNRVELREDYLERTLALVADAEPCEGGVRTNTAKIEEAQRVVEEAKRLHMEKSGKPGQPLDWKYAQQTYTGPRTWVQEYVRRNFPPIDGVYKSVLPLRAVRVVGEPKPQPPTDAERIAQDQLKAQSEAMAAALAKHFGNNTDKPRKRSKPDNT